ncbi:MAG TPA: transglutaminase family protein [Bryobacteraceae bacterium]|nr:transglutaminase family protein [Bryobacteraceae bacterium]
MNRYKLTHVTSFVYDGPVSESYNEVRLRPMQDDTQSCISFRLSTYPESRTSSHFDFFGNWVHRFNVLGEHRHLRVEADSVVLVQDPPEIPATSIPLAELDRLQGELDEHYDFLATTTLVPHLADLRDLVDRTERSSKGDTVAFVQAASDLVHHTFDYVKGATHVHSSVRDTLAKGAGVCQDFAHILLGMVRLKGLPGRYVSGYLVPPKTAAPGASVEEVIGGQATHAWTEVFIPRYGWIPFDPTLGKKVGRQHVRVAYGRDYADVAPVRGVYKGHAGQQLSVNVLVRPALNGEGNEELKETAAIPPELVESQQQQQQQQQQ